MLVFSSWLVVRNVSIMTMMDAIRGERKNSLDFQFLLGLYAEYCESFLVPRSLCVTKQF